MLLLSLKLLENQRSDLMTLRPVQHQRTDAIMPKQGVNLGFFDIMTTEQAVKNVTVINLVMVSSVLPVQHARWSLIMPEGKQFTKLYARTIQRRDYVQK